MEKVTVKKQELLDEIRKNREKHIAEHADSIEDYKILASQKIEDGMKKLQALVKDLKAGQILNLGYVDLQIKLPENHKSDYDRAIKMLEMSVDDTIEIPEQLFNQYVMDSWEWKERFTQTYTSNKMAALNFAAGR